MYIYLVLIENCLLTYFRRNLLCMVNWQEQMNACRYVFCPFRKKDGWQRKSLLCPSPDPLNSVGGPSNSGVREGIQPRLFGFVFLKTSFYNSHFQITEREAASWRLGDEIHRGWHSLFCRPQQENDHLHWPSHGEILSVCFPPHYFPFPPKKKCKPSYSWRGQPG